MLTMEAELRALREELTSRPSKTSKHKMPTDVVANDDITTHETSSSAAKQIRLSQSSNEDESGDAKSDVKSVTENDTSEVESVEKTSNQ